MSPTTYSLHALAEALAPLSHSLAAGLLVRPMPALVAKEGDGAAERLAGNDIVKALCVQLGKAFQEHVPAIRDAMAALETCEEEELEELVDELASPALELVDMARAIWASELPPAAEGLRPLLATLAEAPVTQILQWVLEILHLVVDPWSLSDDPENPDPGFRFEVPDGPIREAITLWGKEHPGVLPQDVVF
ncbi:hypothetical protein LJC46_00215 [Desulfovibrio sp. OttesenSCG-928-G15]|nr:hypothetical protein [Desulfovibrio sp. OttesenSCG-928-G15]